MSTPETASEALPVALEHATGVVVSRTPVAPTWPAYVLVTVFFFSIFMAGRGIRQLPPVWHSQTWHHPIWGNICITHPPIVPPPPGQAGYVPPPPEP